MISLAAKNNCTACGACEFVCHKHAITMRKDYDTESLYPFIDETQCVSCHLCEKKCPALNMVDFNAPFKAYAAWNTNTDEMNESASGGIAAAAYSYSLSKGYVIAGAVQNKDLSVSIDVDDNPDILKSLKNSKYVFSSLNEAYLKIKKCLISKRKVIVIALPCQIAAIKRVFKEYDNLILGDVVCHGVISTSILHKYVHFLEQRFDKDVSKMYFRDPAKGTQTFTFSLYDNQGNCFYAKRTAEGELYNYAYHGQIAYRENCYHCKYAQPLRVSDFTLSDYKGLGTIEPWNGRIIKVSSVLINTKVGEAFIDRLIQSGLICAHERPIKEPIQGDPQLNHPSKKTNARKHYEILFKKEHGNFIKVINKVRKYDLLRRKCIFYVTLPLRILRKIYKSINI